jgi:copper resistance protein B
LDGQTWFGGDVNRLFVKTEGDETLREWVVAAEVQALFSRAVES